MRLRSTRRRSWSTGAAFLASPLASALRHKTRSVDEIDQIHLQRVRQDRHAPEGRHAVAPCLQHRDPLLAPPPSPHTRNTPSFDNTQRSAYGGTRLRDKARYEISRLNRPLLGPMPLESTTLPPFHTGRLPPTPAPYRSLKTKNYQTKPIGPTAKKYETKPICASPSAEPAASLSRYPPSRHV